MEIGGKLRIYFVIKLRLEIVLRVKEELRELNVIENILFYLR